MPSHTAASFDLLRGPHWEAWNGLHTLPMWKAVALASGEDPDVHGWTAAEVDGARFQDGATLVIPRPTIDLIDRAHVAWSVGALRLSPASVNPQPSFPPLWLEGEVDMSEFTAWLLKVGHALPAGFPWMPAELNTDSLIWPWGNHSTDDLALLARAAVEFWRAYDPKHPRTAPKNEVVIAWLKEQGMGERKAEVVASLLRPDALPTGPRRK